MKRLALAVISAMLLVPVMPASAGGGGGCQLPTATEATGDAVDVGKFCMSPTVLRTKVGTTVSFRNYDPVDHTVTPGVGSWGDDLLSPGETITHTFDAPGLYPFYCRLHSAMGGVVQVGDVSSKVSTTPVAATEPAGATSLAIPLGVGLVVGGGALGFTLGRKGARA